MKRVLIIVTILFSAFIATSFLVKKPEAPKIGIIHAIEGRQHLETLSQSHAPYKSDLPTSGPHYINEAPWGVSEVPIQDEQWIHNLEHGGIVITYKPNLAPDKIAELTSIATDLTMKDNQTEKKGFKVVLIPREANTSSVQLSSWGYSLNLDKVESAKIVQFYRDRPNNAPEANVL